MENRKALPMLFPDIGVINRFHLGDTVILEPIASIISERVGSPVYVISAYSDIFQAHPRIKAIGYNDPFVQELRTIDPSDAIQSSSGNLPIPGKLKRIYESCGLSSHSPRKPELFLSENELSQSRQMKSLFPGTCIGVGPTSRLPIKECPLFENELRKLSKRYDHIFAFSDRLPRFIERKNWVHRIIGRPLREVMVALAAMDGFLAVDSGIAHLAGAIGVPLVVCGYDVFEDLYEPYPQCLYISSSFEKRSLKSIKPRHMDLALKNVQFIPKRRETAMMLLEGLGGTVTISDHANKFHELSGSKAHIVIRRHSELFDDNPHIASVTAVGNPRYSEVLPRMVEEFAELICIKTGVAARYLERKRQPMTDFWRELFESHPLGKKAIENRYGLNMVQSANLSLGWPYERDHVEVFAYGHLPDLPKDYVAFSNGVDTWHKGLKQTKSWPHGYWETLVPGLDIPMVQVGTEYDRRVSGAIDLRMKTTIPELLSILKAAKAIVCTEGGLMHLAHAVRNVNTVVLRGPTAGKFYYYPELHNIDSGLCQPCYWETPDWYENCPRGLNAVCMKSIRPGRVIANLERILNEDLVQDTHIPSMLVDSGLELPPQSVQSTGCEGNYLPAGT